MADQQPDRTGDKQPILGRRDALKLIGGTTLATLGLGTASGAEQTETFVIDAADSAWSYSIDTNGDVSRMPTDGDITDTISDGSIEGTVESGLAAYEVSGDITALTLDGSSAMAFGPDAASLLPEANEIVVRSDSVVDYELTTSGPITKVLNSTDVSAEVENDTVTENDDGTYTVVGHTGNGYGDSYRFRGDVVDFTPLDGDVSIELNGESVTTYELTGTERQSSELSIVSQTTVDYEFTANGQIEKRFDAGKLSAETGNDTVTDNGDGTWTASGHTGNGYGDTYSITGDVTDFSPMDGDYTLYLDQVEVTPYELTGTEEPTDSSPTDSTGSTGSPIIGGGDGYGDTVQPSEATTTVDTASGLASALSNASSGDVVYIAGNAEIDLGSRKYSVPNGVTLASDRGVDGAAGGHIYTGYNTWPVMNVGAGARLTGFRFSGPNYSYMSYDQNAVGMGIRVNGSNVEIDNCEVYGFSHAAIRPSGDTHVHHNHIHHNPMNQLGYGVSVTSGSPLIEYNRMNYNRHSVAGSGGCGYTARYNHFGAETIDHVIDMHKPGGTTMEIHHNTIEATSHVQDSGRPEGVAIRGVPDDVADVHGNWFYNTHEPKSSPEGWDGCAITQVHTSSWQNVAFQNNHYGSDEPAPDIGCPR